MHEPPHGQFDFHRSHSQSLELLSNRRENQRDPASSDQQLGHIGHDIALKYGVNISAYYLL